MPADGATAATVQNGDFGTSPFFEQLSDKLKLACTCLCGLSDAKRKSGQEIRRRSRRSPPSEKTWWFPAHLGRKQPRVLL